MILGAIFVTQYFYGGNYGQGNLFLLLFGLAFIGYGLYGFVEVSRRNKK
jgi:hypothetical protein